MIKTTTLLLIAIITLISCSKEKEMDLIFLEISEKSLNFEQEYQIEAMSDSDIIYTTENEYHTTVSETGLITANFVGETNILLQNEEDQKNIKITVEPKYNTYPEPELKFGTTKNEMINKYGNNYNEAPLDDEENFTLIGYNNYSSKAPIILFVLDSDQKITSYALLISSQYTTELVGFLTERYLAYAKQDKTFYFINQLEYENANLLLGLEIYNEDYFIVQYFNLSSPGDLETFKTTVSSTNKNIKDMVKYKLLKNQNITLLK